MKFKPFTVAVYTGLFMAVAHALWSLLIYLKFAKTIMDFIFNLHMISNPYKILAFSFQSALNLVLFTFAVGFVVGYIATIGWNMMQKRG